MKTRHAWKMVRRHLLNRRVRTSLTLLGIALAVTLFTAIQAFSSGMDAALTSGDKTRTLVVYRKNRYCPQTSILPERYREEIASVPGVRSVLPVKVFLNNCRTNLDMVTFHGAPADALLANRDLSILEGSAETFRSEPDAALVGLEFARRRGLRVGEKFRFGEIVVKVAGIYRSRDVTQDNLILTHLEFLQRAGPIDRLGTVTQFEVLVDDSTRAEAIAKEVDARLATAEEPTDTRSLSVFLQRATKDLREILRFGRLFGAACVVVVMVLVGNTLHAAVHERRRELGVLLAIGFQGRHLAGMVLMEAGVLALLGSGVGLLAITAILHRTSLAIGVEGVQVGFQLGFGVAAFSVGVALVGSLLASGLPAWRAATLPVLQVLRSGG